MNMISKVLRRNMSRARIAGFILSNFMGLLIVAASVQFYADAGSIWKGEDSFVKADYLVVNKRVTTESMLDPSLASFRDGEIADLEAQPWVRSVGKFSSSAFKVNGAISRGGAGFTSALFFEAVPDRFVDVRDGEWDFKPGDAEIPLIIPKDYLALYNFGFASSAGMPRLSEQLIGSIPLRLRMTGDTGESLEMPGRIVGFSNRLNTILVPESFLSWANGQLSPDQTREAPSRLIVDVSSPGDVAIADYLSAHGLEQAGDHSRSSAAFLLKLVAGIVAAVGLTITVMSLFILLLSLSLLMEKNRDKIHSLLMLGVPLGEVGAPYRRIALSGCTVAAVLAIGGVWGLRCWYLTPLEGLGALPGTLLPAVAVSVVLGALTVGVNWLAIGRRVRQAWRRN